MSLRHGATHHLRMFNYRKQELDGNKKENIIATWNKAALLQCEHRLKNSISIYAIYKVKYTHTSTRPWKYSLKQYTERRQDTR